MKKEAYKHGYSGSCSPKDGHGVWDSQETFSVGIFQWIPKSSGTGLKKTAVKYRVKGRVEQYKAVYKRAEEICSRMDNLTWVYNKKSEMVR